MSDRDHNDGTGDGPGADDTEALLGAYVLDAVDDVERRRVERLLDTDPEARAEVDRLNAVADRLAEAAAAGASAPSDLLGSILARTAAGPSRSAGEAPTPPPAVEPVRRPPAAGTGGAAAGSAPEAAAFDRRARATGRGRAPWILSAAAVVILFVVGAVVVTTRGSDDGVTDSVAAMQQLAADAATRPGARTGVLTDADATVAVQVVVDPQGHAFVMSGVLPRTDGEHTYQLWAVDGGTPVSLGLLGSEPQMSVVGVDSHVHTLAITLEPAGGSAGPTTAPMASGTLDEV